MKRPCVYIVTNRRFGALYIGVTADFALRIFQHRTGASEGFTKRYGIAILVWYEHHDTLEAAIRREKQIKEWKRAWKIELIESMNPDWFDLYAGLNQ